MKKLMIAAAVAMVAIASQAAVAFNWNSVAITDGQATPALATGLPVYLFASGTTGEGTTITRAALMAALEGKTYASVEDAWKAVGYGPANMKTDANGKVVKAVDASTVTRGATDGDVMKFFFVAQNAKGDLFFSIEKSNVTVQYAEPTVVAFAAAQATTPSMGYIEKADLATASKGGWITMSSPGPIPEPTSGLLLLLGVAGLALRRKHV